MYTQIPNQLFDYLPLLSGAATKIILAVARQTYGWHKSTAQISRHQLEELTGLSRTTIAVAVADLENAGLLHVQRSKIDGVNDVNVYQIVLPTQEGSPKINPPRTRKKNETSNRGRSKIDPPQKQIKQAETIIEHTIQEFSTDDNQPNGGGSEIDLPQKVVKQAETLTEHTTQEFSMEQGGRSISDLGVGRFSSPYKERNLKKIKEKKREDLLALQEPVVPMSPLMQPPQESCPQCKLPTTMFELERYGYCQFCYAKSVSR